MMKIARVLLAVATLALLVALASTAFGEEEKGAVSARGQCDAGSAWRLTIAQETGISIEFNMETGVPDQTWHYAIRYNRHVILETNAVTEDDGGFEIRKVENNAIGRDTVQVQATNEQTG